MVNDPQVNLRKTKLYETKEEARLDAWPFIPCQVANFLIL